MQQPITPIEFDFTGRSGESKRLEIAAKECGANEVLVRGTGNYENLRAYRKISDPLIAPGTFLTRRA